MNTKRAMGMAVILVAMLACQSAQAFYNPHTGRWLSRDPIGEQGGKHLHGYVANDSLGKVDRLGTDAAIVNYGGYTGHTSFVVSNPHGGVRVFHFYARGHQRGGCCGLESVLAICCDKVSIWYEDNPSLTNYLQTQLALSANVKVVAYASGTPLDDQLTFEDLNEQAAADVGLYSLALGKECHKKSWQWFREYLEGGSELYPFLSSGGAPPWFWPERWFGTRRYLLSLPQIPTPTEPRPFR